MSYPMSITQKDIFHQFKISAKIPEIIQQIVQRKIIKNMADELGIKVEVAELQQTADQMRLVNNLTNADETWTWLKKHCLSLDDFEEIVYNTLLSAKLSHHLFAAEVEPYFYNHQLDYLGAVMYEVMLDDEDLAWELFYIVQEGEKCFYDVAHQYIQDVQLRRQGGYCGVMRRQDLHPDISAAVFAANPPQLLKPIVTAKGIHLIFVEEIIQPQLDEQLSSKIMVDLFAQWLQQKVKNINLELAV